MADERAGPVEKLVLLQQCCCDKRCKGSHHGVLAVIVDACRADKPRCFIGPTAIGQIAGLNPRSVRSCLRDLEAWGYLTTEKRNSRSDWYSPNFRHAERTGQLVERDKEAGSMRVHRPACKTPARPSYAGPQVRLCGSADPSMRVHRPEEAIDLNHSKKAFVSEPVLSPEEQEQERLQEEANEQRLNERARDMYLKAKADSDYRIMEMIERNHGHRIRELLPPGSLPELKA